MATRLFLILLTSKSFYLHTLQVIDSYPPALRLRLTRLRSTRQYSWSKHVNRKFAYLRLCGDLQYVVHAGAGDFHNALTSVLRAVIDRVGSAQFRGQREPLSTDVNSDNGAGV